MSPTDATADPKANPSAEARAEAMAWRVRLSEDPAQASALDAWVAQAPAHAAAWREVQALWGLLGDNAAAPEAMALRRGALARAQDARRRRSPRAIAALAASAAGVALLGGLLWQYAQGDTYHTAQGERRTLTLQDGSTITLDAASKLRVRYTERGRDLTLVRGQARFDVARDPLRPFAVTAGDRRVVATGTAFNVELLDQAVTVTLIEGRVVVMEPAASRWSLRGVAGAQQAGDGRGGPVEMNVPGSGDGTAHLPNAALELRQGERLVTSADRAPQVTRIDPARVTAWQHGQLIFDDEPLATVAARVSRYTRQPVTVADEAAAQLRLSGVFNTGDLQAFLTTVANYLPVDVVQVGERRVELHSRRGQEARAAH